MADINVKVTFDKINVKEKIQEHKVKILMLKGEKGDTGEAGQSYDDTEVRGLISANTSDISSLQSDVSANTSEISDLQNRLEFEIVNSMNDTIKDTTSLVFVKGNNLYDENTMLELVGAYRAENSGNIITSATNKGLKLQAEPNSVYTITQTGASNYHEIAFFDKSFRYLSGTAITSTQITTPANCYIMTIQTNINATNIMINKGSTALPYEPHVENQIHIKNKNDVFEKFYGENELNQENYSLNEMKIGTWIDGKPLYRTVYTSSNYATNYYVPTPNIKELVNVHCMLHRSDYPNMWQPVPSRLDNAGMSAQLGSITVANNTNINMVFGTNWSNSFNKIIFIVEYTKTTD